MLRKLFLTLFRFNLPWRNVQDSHNRFSKPIQRLTRPRKWQNGHFTTYGQFSTDNSTRDYLIFLSNKMNFRNSSFPLECSKAKKCKIQTKIESWISHLSPNRNWLYYSPLVTTSGKLISRTVVGGQKNRPDKSQPPNTYSIAIARRDRTLELLQGQILTLLEKEFW